MLFNSYQIDIVFTPRFGLVNTPYPKIFFSFRLANAETMDAPSTVADTSVPSVAPIVLVVLPRIRPSRSLSFVTLWKLLL